MIGTCTYILLSVAMGLTTALYSFQQLLSSGIKHGCPPTGRVSALNVKRECLEEASFMICLHLMSFTLPKPERRSKGRKIRYMDGQNTRISGAVDCHLQ